MGALRRLFGRLAESDEERLAEEFREWAATVPGTTRMSDVRTRSRVRVAGVVRRMTVLPRGGFQVVLSDGTGELTASWTRHREIGGLSLGTRLVVEGVVGEHSGTRRMVNPSFEFAS